MPLELQPAKHGEPGREDATAELARGFETRATGSQRALFSPTELPRLWTSDEVAEFLGVSRSWVVDHSTRRQPRLACVRLGGANRALLRYRRQDVEQFVNEHLRSAGGPFPKRP
jgi:helix-turn-helix protein